MATNLYFSRDTKVYIEVQNGVFEVPVLDGFSFSQANNSTEVTLAEMESSTGVSKRGRRVFNDSLAPVEWSFSTYVRPFKSAGTNVAGNANRNSAQNMHAVEEVLWGMMVAGGASSTVDLLGYTATASGANPSLTGFTTDTTDLDITFANSNKSTLGTANIYFSLDDAGGNPTVYKCTGAVVNEASLDFDIDGIATIQWSGFAASLATSSKPTRTVFEAIDATNNYIRNRLTQLSITSADPVNFPGNSTTITAISSANPAVVTAAGHGFSDGDTIGINGTCGITKSGADIVNGLTFVVASASTNTFALTGLDTSSGTSGSFSGSPIVGDGKYSLTLTGGSATISNNITFLTPETLGSVNLPLGHVTGARSISGSFTCYLALDTVDNDGTSTDFFSDMTTTAARNKVVNSFATTFKIGGASAAPRLEMSFPTAHFEIPAHSIEDVISLETTFQALPSTIDNTNEVTLKYVGVTPA